LNENSWKDFKKAKNRFRKEVDTLSSSLPNLKKIQQEFVNSRSETTYKIETPVVYNSALDDFTAEDEIKLILVGDNPGRREQTVENRRYLVGPSGKIAHKFFRDNPSLQIDYLKNVIILNKTPIHSPRTNDLKELHTEIQGEDLTRIANRRFEGGNRKKHEGLLTLSLESSQVFMADLLLEFYKAFECPVWIIGYSEMKKKGIFESYTERLKEICSENKDFFKQLYFYRHFSMNQFTIDLKKQAQSGETVSKTLKRIGKAYRERILGDLIN